MRQAASPFTHSLVLLSSHFLNNCQQSLREVRVCVYNLKTFTEFLDSLTCSLSDRQQRKQNPFNRRSHDNHSREHHCPTNNQKESQQATLGSYHRKTSCQCHYHCLTGMRGKHQKDFGFGRQKFLDKIGAALNSWLYRTVY